MKKHTLSDILNHLGEDRENYKNAVAPPVFQTSNFSFRSVHDMRSALKKEYETPFYTRGYNPTVGTLRQKLAALEKAEDALVFASGSAAVAAAIFSCVKAGSHVICVKKPYSWTYKILTTTLADLGVTTTFVDGTLIKNFEAAIQENTALIYIESPNSITFELQDIAAVAELAKANNISTIIDNSYSTPLYQSPIEMGIDIVVHSASKYLNGHSDVVAGVLCTSKARIDRIFDVEFMGFGGIISPNDAWLLMRGLRSLEIRLERHSATAEKVVAFLEEHPKIEQVLYPFSESHPQYALAKKQMKGAGGLFSIHLKAKDTAMVERFCDALHHFQLACSWGGYESLQFPMCALHDSENYDNPDIPFNLIRMFVGLEDPEELIGDLQQALEQV